ncbi:MAG TPA: hypothetical protein VGP28_00390 [Methylocella sp.]|jgi:hypothetical protein|nr:hypothetical protein [Methylocella sp.]
MSEPELTQDAADPPDRPREASFLRRKLPYIAVLTLAIVGVAYTNMSHQPISGFWEFLAIAIGAVSVVTVWPSVDDRKARFRLIWTQALHWATILVVMNIMLLTHVQRMVPAPANSLVLLMFLALGTFLAGVNLLSFQICFLGLAMALSVPAIAWFKQSALFLLLAAVLLIGLGITFLPSRSKKYTA